MDICLDAGVNLFDTADVYSDGASEEVLGEAIRGRREQVLISTKSTLPLGDGRRTMRARRGHAWFAASRMRYVASARIISTSISCTPSDAFTPVEEVLPTLDMLVRGGKIRYSESRTLPAGRS